ncbi:MAG: fatty acid desaturase [Gammaproteobacteria bacterium]|nr:fatty acid desaturase [Gammaproteobacteria bacterium]
MSTYQTSPHRQNSVRESMAILPKWLQPWLTHITGKPLSGEKPLVRFPVAVSFIFDFLMLFLLPAAQIFLLTKWSMIGLIMLPVYYVLQVGLLRKFQVVYLHHIVHNALFDRRNVNHFLGDMIVGTVLVQNLSEYAHSHIQHHSPNVFTMEADDDAAFLYKLGFKPGTSVKRLWGRLFWTFVSPYFHFVFLKSRIQSSLVKPNFRVKDFAVCWIFVIVGVVAFSWEIALFVFVIPWFFLYHISALLQFLTEHAWMSSVYAPKSNAEYADRCLGRFCGKKLVIRNGTRVFDILVWTLGMIVFQLPYRYGCLVGDLPAHDWHHVCSFATRSHKKWPEAIYLRQKAIDDRQFPGLEDREMWGLKSALSYVFDRLSRSDYRIEK